MPILIQKCDLGYENPKIHTEHGIEFYCKKKLKHCIQFKRDIPFFLFSGALQIISQDYLIVWKILSEIS